MKDYGLEHKSVGCKKRRQEEEQPVGETLYSIVKCFSIERLTEVGDTKEEVHVYLGE